MTETRSKACPKIQIGMTPDEVATVLRANIGKRVRIAFSDGVIQAVDVGSVDDEGVLHSGPDGVEPKYYWTRFESIAVVETVKVSGPMD